MSSTNRICIYPKDIMRVTGKSERYCRKLLDKIREKNLKEEHQFITVDEFCRFTGITLEQVKPFLAD